MNEELILPGKKGTLAVREIYEWLESGITAVLCVVLLFTFVGRMVGVVGDSMFPTLHDRDRLIATSLYGELKSGDIVVVTQPNYLDEPLIKRVIATAGQQIEIHPETGEVYINNEPLPEPYLVEQQGPGPVIETELPMVVPANCLFVMGDNRNNSLDSRMAEIGVIDERYVLGKIVYRITPYDRFGPVDKKSAS